MTTMTVSAQEYIALVKENEALKEEISRLERKELENAIRYQELKRDAKEMKQEIDSVLSKLEDKTIVI